MLLDILYILFGLLIIAVVSILLKRREVRLKKELTNVRDKNYKYNKMVSSTKSKLQRDIKKLQRKTNKEII